jgi:predicted phage-related endonuclease
MTASVDTMLPRPGMKPKIVELKASAVDSEWGEADTDQIPDNYLIQVQHQMEVMDLDEADVAVFFGTHQFAIYHVERNREIGQHLIQVGREFWDRVKGRLPPDPEWFHPSTPRLMEVMYGVENQCVEFGQDVLDLAKSFRMLTSTRADVEKRRADVKAKLLHAMGNASVAKLPEGFTLKRTKVDRAGYSVEPSSYVRFDIKATKGEGVTVE